MDRGRTPDEHSIIWMSNGQFHSMGYLSKDSQCHDPEDILSSLTRYPDNYLGMRYNTPMGKGTCKKYLSHEINTGMLAESIVTFSHYSQCIGHTNMPWKTYTDPVSMDLNQMKGTPHLYQ